MTALQAIPGVPSDPPPKPTQAPVKAKIVAREPPPAPIQATTEVRGARLDACLHCQQLMENGYCHAGQWFVRIKAKISGGKCPLGKWSA